MFALSLASCRLTSQVLPSMHARWHLSHAQGYFALGLFDLAEEELKALPAPEVEALPARALRLSLLQVRERWPELALLAKDLAQKYPSTPDWWVTWAYATRRAVNLHEAEAILREAEILHPKVGVIHFNLGCYACVRGAFAEARQRIEKAIQLEPSFFEVYASDEDLAGLRALGYRPRRPSTS